jgi:hypothetical protein
MEAQKYIAGLPVLYRLPPSSSILHALKALMKLRWGVPNWINKETGPPSGSNKAATLITTLSQIPSESPLYMLLRYVHTNCNTHQQSTLPLPHSAYLSSLPKTSEDWVIPIVSPEEPGLPRLHPGIPLQVGNTSFAFAQQITPSPHPGLPTPLSLHLQLPQCLAG